MEDVRELAQKFYKGMSSFSRHMVDPFFALAILIDYGAKEHHQ